MNSFGPFSNSSEFFLNSFDFLGIILNCLWIVLRFLGTALGILWIALGSSQRHQIKRPTQPLINDDHLYYPNLICRCVWPVGPRMPGFKGRSGENKYDTGNFHDPIDGVLWHGWFFGEKKGPMWTGPSTKCRTGHWSVLTVCAFFWKSVYVVITPESWHMAYGATRTVVNL